jgi:serine-type D-Ala-D-Ala carboxypeptidase (penicillin-binding protein 5/6)
MMRPNNYKKYILTSVIVLALILAYFYMRPLPAIPPSGRLPAVPKAQSVVLPWPASGQSALGAKGYGVLAAHSSANPVPIGSTAKTITALAVLKQKPITAGTQGKSITLDGSDVVLFNNYYSQGGSVTKVSAGEQITELQALQSMLLPSSNNMADTLAKWAFGSVNAYITYANRMVKNMGLRHTTVGDTNGFSDTTTSTADDMVRLGLAAMQDPSIAKVVGQTSADIPSAGTIKNLNVLLGQEGIYGIKTGYTQKAGGCYLFAAQHMVGGQKISYIGAILGQPLLGDALNESLTILSSADSGFETITPVHKGQTMAVYKATWGASAQLASSQDISVLRWKGQDIRILGEFDSVRAPASAGMSPGKISIISGQHKTSAPAVLAENLSGPSLSWRLFR